MPKRNVRGEEVPKHLLTPEQATFQRRYREMKKIQELLERKTLGLKSELDDTRELWNLLGEGFMRLKPPKEGTHELHGMSFPEEEEEQASGGMGQAPQSWQIRY